jgi:hypothetical protein
MSDEIMVRDNQAGLVMAWHHKTKVVPVVTLDAAFPYEIRRMPMYVNTAVKGPPKFTKVPGFDVFLCSDDNQIAGKPVAATYQAISNERFFGLCQSGLAGTGAIIESAGTIMDRSRRFLTIKLPNDATTIGKRVFKNRISIIDSIDGSTYLYGVNTSTCVVCANTARIVMDDKTGEFRFRLRHTGALDTKIIDMEKTIEGLVGVQAQFNAAMAAADSEPLASADARNLFAGWLGEGADELSTRATNTVERLVELHRGGAGNAGETLLDGIGAVTDFYSHESSGAQEKDGFRWKQWNSSEFGAGAKAKTDFIQSVITADKGRFVELNRVGIADLQRRGAQLLAVN